MFGYSGLIDIEENPLGLEFHETIIIITKAKIIIFSSYPTREYLYKIFSNIEEVEVEYYFPTKNDEDNSVLNLVNIIGKTTKLKNFIFPQSHEVL